MTKRTTAKRDMAFRPMRVHKNLVIQCLTMHPEDIAKLAPGWEGTADEYIAALKSDPHVYFVNGELVGDDD